MSKFAKIVSTEKRETGAYETEKNNNIAAYFDYTNIRIDIL